MSPAIPRIVLDTNIILRGLLSRKSASAQLLTRCEKRDVIVLLSDNVLAEYRFIITSPEIQGRFPSLDPACVELILARLRYVGEWVRINRRFAFPRDPRDAKLLELAISGQATDLVTSDRDLLDLSTGHDEAAKRLRQRLPAFHILEPAGFLRKHFPL